MDNYRLNRVIWRPSNAFWLRDLEIMAKYDFGCCTIYFRFQLDPRNNQCINFSSWLFLKYFNITLVMYCHRHANDKVADLVDLFCFLSPTCYLSFCIAGAWRGTLDPSITHKIREEEKPHDTHMAHSWFCDPCCKTRTGRKRSLRHHQFFVLYN